MARRLDIVRRLRHALSDAAPELLDGLSVVPGRTRGESVPLEILPLADALRFLERNARSLLKPRRLGVGGRPVWLHGVRAEIRREPYGAILILAPSNYPLFLAASQALQALVAGNAVLLKPAPGCSAPMRTLGRMLAEAGLPPGLFMLLGEDVAEAKAAVAEGVDLVVLTGSATTGRTILADLAPLLVPAILELSGSDPVIVLEGAHLPMVADALAWGVRLNGGATCIAPRRVFVPRARAADLERLLRERLDGAAPAPVPARVRDLVGRLLDEAEGEGGRLLGPRPDLAAAAMKPLVIAEANPRWGLLRSDIFAPVMSVVAVDGADQAVAMARDCPYALGASVFGPEPAAREVAARLDAGVVTINDLIAPTADPRLPFGGRGASGYGVTRGAEGLLALTRPKAISVRGGRFRPHFQPARPGDEALFLAALELTHGRSLGARLKAMARLIRGLAQSK